MKLHANDSQGPFYRVIDTRTGNEIDDVIYADDDEGFYIQHARDPHGMLIRRAGHVVTNVRRAPIRLERINVSDGLTPIDDETLEDKKVIPFRLRGGELTPPRQSTPRGPVRPFDRPHCQIGHCMTRTLRDDSICAGCPCNKNKTP